MPRLLSSPPLPPLYAHVLCPSCCLLLQPVSVQTQPQYRRFLCQESFSPPSLLESSFFFSYLFPSRGVAASQPSKRPPIAIGKFRSARQVHANISFLKTCLDFFSTTIYFTIVPYSPCLYSVMCILHVQYSVLRIIGTAREKEKIPD